MIQILSAYATDQLNHIRSLIYISFGLYYVFLFELGEQIMLQPCHLIIYEFLKQSFFLVPAIQMLQWLRGNCPLSINLSICHALLLLAPYANTSYRIFRLCVKLNISVPLQDWLNELLKQIPPFIGNFGYCIRRNIGCVLISAIYPVILWLQMLIHA